MASFGIGLWLCFLSRVLPEPVRHRESRSAQVFEFIELLRKIAGGEVNGVQLNESPWIDREPIGR